MADIRKLTVIKSWNRYEIDADFNKTPCDFYVDEKKKFFPEKLIHHAVPILNGLIVDPNTPLNSVADNDARRYTLCFMEKALNIDPCGHNDYIKAIVHTIPDRGDRNIYIYINDSLGEVFEIPDGSKCMIDGVEVDPHEPIKPYVGRDFEEHQVTLIDTYAYKKRRGKVVS